MCVCIYVYVYVYSHPGADRICFLMEFLFWQNTVIFEPIDRIWIPGGVQPSVHSETASSTMFYLWVWKMTFCIFENPGILSTPGWLYVFVHEDVYVHVHVDVYVHAHAYVCVYVDVYADVDVYVYMYICPYMYI